MKSQRFSIKYKVDMKIIFDISFTSSQDMQKEDQSQFGVLKITLMMVTFSNAYKRWSCSLLNANNLQEFAGWTKIS